MRRTFHLFVALMLPTAALLSRESTADSLLHKATLDDCIRYGLAHEPSIQQSLNNEEIANQQIRAKLADWLPQVSFNFTMQHNYKLPTSIFQGNPINIGVTNTSSGQFSLTQTLFNKDVLLASSTAGEVRREAEQFAENTRIQVIVNISKAYYAVLLTQNQIDLTHEDIARLEQSVRDSYNQYKGGVVDKTDYLQATIALNNARAELRQNEEQLNTGYAQLKSALGYPPDAAIDLDYSMTTLEAEAGADTTRSLHYENRIEYQVLQTQRELQEANLDYYEWSFLPSLSLFGEYNLNYQSNRFSALYDRNFPNSYAGLQLSFPIFEGGKRIHQIDQAKIELKQIGYEQAALENAINTDYVRALGSYKSNLNTFLLQKDNLALAKEVYSTIQLQYKSGIKTYLDVITAETNLKTTQATYLNALYQVLISKTDLEQALGTLH